MMTYQNVLEYLDGLNTFGVKLGLVRIERLLALMGDPQKRYKTIHVTGTNGKGSTSAMLAEILTQARIRTGLYTSPHLTSYTERMRIDGQAASEEVFASVVAVVKGFADQMVAEGDESPTQFEILTAAAFYYFAELRVEYAVIEVGLGGLLDSTNVIVPEVSVITNVAMDHVDRCGGTLEDVARHKAGIIKEGVPVITAAQGESLEVIRVVAEEKNADLFVAGEDFKSSFERLEEKQQRLNFSSELLGVGATYTLGLLGAHQIENSAVAIMTALLVANTEKRITSEIIHHALGIAAWGGRFEIFEDGCGRVTIVDGAHNPAGAEGLRRNLDLYFPARGIVFLLGILKDKDIDGIIRALVRPEDMVVVTEPESERAAAAAFVAAKVSAKHVEICANIEAGLQRSRELAEGDQLICVAGSLYLIGRVRASMLKEKLDR